MAFYIKGNRILSEDEYNNEEGGFGAALALLGLSLSPGIILTSFIEPFFLFTTGHLWASVITGCIVVAILMYFFIGLSFYRYLICSVICAGFIGLFTLYSSNNIFWNTTKALFEAGPYANKGEKAEKKNTSNESSIENSNGKTTSFTESAYTIPNTDEQVEEETSINDQVSDDDSYELTSQNEETSEVEQDCDPSFPGGNAALLTYITNTMKYPVIAEECGVEGIVYVDFEVDYDGSIINVKIAKSVDPSLDAEAIRIIESMPKWNVGRKNGEPIRKTIRYPIKFKLSR